jgi:hypothetical protein
VRAFLPSLFLDGALPWQHLQLTPSVCSLPKYSGFEGKIPNATYLLREAFNLSLNKESFNDLGSVILNSFQDLTKGQDEMLNQA